MDRESVFLRTCNLCYGFCCCCCCAQAQLHHHQRRYAPVSFEQVCRNEPSERAPYVAVDTACLRVGERWGHVVKTVCVLVCSFACGGGSAMGFNSAANERSRRKLAPVASRHTSMNWLKPRRTHGTAYMATGTCLSPSVFFASLQLL